LTPPEDAGLAYERLLAENDDLDCIFIVWDVPALKALSEIRQGARGLPMITVDLGNEIAAELQKGGPLKGIAAQRPYDQGGAAATAALLGLIGRSPPSWITSTGLKVTRNNLREAYEAVWQALSDQCSLPRDGAKQKTLSPEMIRPGAEKPGLQK
jgi:ribose transport system substrate-binding protein